MNLEIAIKNLKKYHPEAVIGKPFGYPGPIGILIYKKERSFLERLKRKFINAMHLDPNGSINEEKIEFNNELTVNGQRIIVYYYL